MTRARGLRLAMAAVALGALIGFVVLRSSGTKSESAGGPETTASIRAPQAALLADIAEPDGPDATRIGAPIEQALPPATELASKQPLQFWLVHAPRSGLTSAADVEIEFGFGDGYDVGGSAIGRGRSDANGLARIDCEASKWRAAIARRDWLWARVPGSRPESAAQWFELDDDPWLQAFTVVVDPSPVVRGIVLDPSGSPTVAIVRAVRETNSGFDAVVSTTKSRRDGTFAIATHGEAIVDVVARSEAHGIASARKVDVAGQAYAAPLELRLAGPGVLRGIVRDTRGRSVAGFPMRASTAQLSSDEVYYSRSESSIRFDLVDSTREIELEGSGLACVSFRTDSRGEFEVRGLRDDQYVLHGPGWLPGATFPGQLLTTEPVRSDGVPLDLVTSSAVLHVRVENPDGTPWQPALAHLREADPDARVVAIRKLEPWAVAHMQPEAADCTDLGGGLFTFVTPTFGAEATYRVGVRGRGLNWSPLDVRVPEGAGVIDVRLGARPLEEGTLKLTLRHPPTIDPSARVVLRVLDIMSGASLMEPRKLRPIDGPTFTFAIPAGVYRIELDASPIPGDRESGRGSIVEKVGLIWSRQERALDFEFPVGARIVVNVKGSEGPVGEPRPRGPSSLTLERYGELTRPVLFPKLDPADGRIVDWIRWSPELGTRVSGPLPAGSCTILVALQDLRVGRARVELRDGETTTVDIEVE